MNLPPLTSFKLPPLPSKPEPKVEVKTSDKLPALSNIALPTLSQPEEKKLPSLLPQKVEIKVEEKLRLKVGEKLLLPSSLPPLNSTKQELHLPSNLSTPSPTKQDLHLDTYFSKRNGVVPNPIEGKNFTRETLSYMTSFNRANQITQVIVDKMKNLGFSNFEIVENCSGIGGNTLSFLDNSTVTHVTAYEILPERRMMLRNNIEMYQFPKSKYTIPDVQLGDLTCNLKNNVFFTDAPWLSETIKDFNTKDYKNEYLLSGITCGSKTLEQWITACPQCALIVNRVPPGYKLGEIPGFITEEVLIKNSLLLISRPLISNKMREMQERDRLEKQKEHEEYLKWRSELKNFLRYAMLPRAVQSEAALDKLVNDDAMKIWEVAFTHESFNPNKGENYEELEIYGDVVLDLAYMKFIMQSYPELDRSQLSELRTTYLAKPFQSKLSQEVGLGSFIRTLYRKSIHMNEDALESFFGALETLGDQQFKFGAGAGIAYNMLVSLYQNVEIDMSATVANPKTIVKERYERMGIISTKAGQSVTEDITAEENGKVSFKIIMPNNGIAILKSYGITSEPVIAHAIEYTKKTASDVAYRQAVKYLDSIGLTKEFLEEVKRFREMENPEIKPYIALVQDRLKLDCIEYFYFTEHHVKGKGQTTGKYVQMIGVGKDGKKRVLKMTTEPTEVVLEGKKDILTRYANYEK